MGESILEVIENNEPIEIGKENKIFAGREVRVLVVVIFGGGWIL